MRASRKTLLICALAALLPLGFQGAQAATATAVTPMALGPGTPIDAMIDHAVNLKAAQLNLSATDRLVARELHPAIDSHRAPRWRSRSAHALRSQAGPERPERSGRGSARP